MSHQTGIHANAELKKYFSKCRDGKHRVMKISIENEQLSLAKHQSPKGSWDQDFDKYVPSMIIEDQPCYILYRLDTTNSLGHEWLLLSWSPDSAPVRQKMLYASTKATLKQEFGSSHIKDEMHATVKEEVSLKGYKAHLSGISAPAPLTDREEALKELQQTEHNTNYGTDSRQSTIGGVSFPITEAAEQGIIDLSRGAYNYLQFKIDLEAEKIHLSKAAKISLIELPQQVPADQARYHLYIFKHSHEGDHMESIVFIYSMPGYSCSIKERMMYSSCKGQFLEIIEKMGLEIAKREEVSLKGYKAHLSGISAPAPLTDREEALKELQQTEHNTNYGTDSRQSTIGGVSFPITEAAEQGIIDLSRGAYNYLQFKIDLEAEKIHLSKAAKISLIELPQQVPADQARYHLYIFKHSHEGDHMESIVFIYSMPGYSCSIKERMMYSSCKGQFLEIIEKMGLEIAKRLEIDDGKELTEEFLYDEIHPKRNLHRPAFAKPKGPPNRGAKRITKSQTAQ